MQVNEPLMDTHLEAIPGLGTLTTGRLPGSDPQGLRKPNTRYLADALRGVMFNHIKR